MDESWLSIHQKACLPFPQVNVPSVVVPARYCSPVAPVIWDEMPPEIWVIIFDKANPHEFGSLQIASKWCRNLFWDFRSDYSGFGETAGDLDVMNVMRLCNSLAARTISFAHTSITDLSLYLLVSLGLTHVHSISLEGTKITNESIEPLVVALPGLHNLNLRGCLISDMGVAQLTSLTRLRVLSLEDCRRITEWCLPSIGMMTSLVHLEFSASHSKLLALDKGQGVAVRAGDLERLNDLLGDCSFANFTNLVNLETLDTGPFMAMTPAAVDVVSVLPRLQHLRIQQSQLLDQTSLEKIASMPGLLELHLYKCQFVHSFASLSKHKLIRSLNLRGCFIKDKDLDILADMPAIERLNISDCAKITDQGLCAFFLRSKASQLKWIKIADCKRVALYAYHDWMQTTRDAKGEITNWIPFVGDDNKQ